MEMSNEMAQRLAEETGTDTEHGRLKANLQPTCNIIALLNILRYKGVLNDDDIDAYYNTVDLITDNMATFQLSCIKMAIATESDVGVNSAQRQEMEQWTCDIISTGRWLLNQCAVAIPPGARSELIEVLAQCEEQLKELEASKGVPEPR